MAMESDYIHGSSPDEQHRLALLNDLLNKSCLAELGLKVGDRVLDLGSGTGQFTRLMAGEVGGTGRVLGIERDRRQLDEAKRLAEASGETRVDFRQGDALALPLREDEVGTFDLAHAQFLLEHIAQPEKAISEMVRAVRPGGRVFVSDDDHGNFRPWPDPSGFASLWQAYVKSFEALGNDPYVGRRLVWLLKDTGLTSLRNTSVFFGGCAGNARFEAIADNLIAAIRGAGDAMLSGGYLNERAFTAGLDGLHQWRADPSAVLWYTVCCAEGVVPND